MSSTPTQLRQPDNALAICFSNVSFSYRTMPVISKADFTLRCGDLCVLEGGNGAGKSTFARLLLGELVPDQGTVELFGHDPSQFTRRSEIGYVPQQTPADYERFPATVLEIVRAGLYADAKPLLPYRRRHRMRALEVLASVDLQGLERRLIGELSGGQFQRVLLARALVAAPRLLILDEPTSNLDDQSTKALYRIVDEARLTIGAAVLLITHDLARMPDLHGSVWKIERGTLRCVSSARHTLDTHGGSYGTGASCETPPYEASTQKGGITGHLQPPAQEVRQKAR